MEVAVTVAVTVAVGSNCGGGMGEVNDFRELNAFSDAPLAEAETEAGAEADASEENIERWV